MGIWYWSESALRVCPADGEGECASMLPPLPGRNLAGIAFAGRGSEGNPRCGGTRSAAEATEPLLGDSTGY
jgi:hypothetical protein